MPSDKERFLKYVEITDNCWYWKGKKGSNGVGIFYLDKKYRTAPKASYMLFVGAVPDYLYVYKRCENMFCVNPEHLILQEYVYQPYTHKSLEERFLEKIEKTESCWIWKGATARKWGGFMVNGYLKPVQEVSYKFFRGEILEGQIVQRTCENTLCVNPEHLIIVDPSDVKSRFLKHVQKTETCWLWVGANNSDGYGNFSYENRIQKASRVSYLLFNGPIAEGLFVLHRCDNPPCVNPEHLFLGTHTDNMQDMYSKGRNSKKKIDSGIYQQIMDLRDTGLTHQEIADKFNISRGWVSHLYRKGRKTA